LYFLRFGYGALFKPVWINLPPSPRMNAIASKVHKMSQALAAPAPKAAPKSRKAKAKAKADVVES